MILTLSPVLTGVPGEPPTFNVGMAETFSWIPIENNANRPLFARASYITNLKDLSISLSASDINIGGVSITDGQDSTIQATVVRNNQGNLLRVLTQSLQATGNNIAIGDSSGNLVSVNSLLSALKVCEVSPITGININNSINLSDINNNNVSVVPSTSSLNVNVTNPIIATVDQSVGFPISFANTTNVDAFNRLRTSLPTTLFDSSHRYRDNGLWSSLTVNGGSCVFNSNQGLVEMITNNLSGSSAIRETTKVFSYQPGKSLLILNTFVMAASANNLQQRVGYFGRNNGMYFELDGANLNFVKRSSVSGTLQETVVPLSAWNGDKLDGSGPSGFTIDITKGQILWMDIEWLGLGTVRMGFVINGQFIVCHSFHHANNVLTTYITTASLPIRYEITNKNTVNNGNSSHVLKQVCSSVISEGGYELRGVQQSIGTAINAPKDLLTAGIFYPIITIRLKQTHLDAIVILSALSVLGISNNANYNWKIFGRSVTSGGSGVWLSAGTDSAVEYKLDATFVTNGKILASGFMQGSNQGSNSTDIAKDALFKFQLERDSLTNTPYEITLAVAAGTDGADVLASLDWEEVTR